jgi:hypothetical protein
MKNVMISIILILTFLPFIAKSQTTQYNLPPKSFYRFASITLKDFTKYECKDLSIKSDSASFRDINKRLAESVALANVDYIRVKEGNQVVTGILFGALIMGLTSASSAMNYNYNYNSQNAGPIIVVCTVTGGLIGGLIGLAVPKWKTYYLEN